MNQNAFSKEPLSTAGPNSASTSPEPSTQPMTPDSSNSVSPPQTPAPVNKRSHKGLWMVLVILIVVVGAGLGYTVHHNHHAKSVKQTTVKTIDHLSIGIKQVDFGDSIYPKAINTSGNETINAQMFEGLVRYENQNQIVPALASGWTNPSDTAWLFTIKSGVKFHDGHVLTAADVQYSIDSLIKGNSDYAQTFASTISSVKVVNNNQVEVDTAQPDPALLNRLSFIYIIDHNPPAGSEPSQAGTGPYMIKPGTSPTSKQVEMTAFNDYHDGPVLTKALSFTGVNDVNDLLKGFSNHSFNIIGEVPYDKASQPSAHIFLQNDTTVDFIAFNTASSPLTNKLVREAVRYAVDPSTIGRAAGYKVNPISQLIPPSIPGYNPAIMPYQKNITKAKQLLAQAGYPNGISLTLSTNDSSPAITELVNELKQVGINVHMDYQADFNSFLTNFLGGKGELFFLGYGSDTLDGVDILQSTIVPANYSNPTFYSQLNKAAATTDPAGRLKLLQQAETTIDNDVATVPIDYRDDIWLMDKAYVLKQDLPGVYVSVYFYKVHQ